MVAYFFAMFEQMLGKNSQNKVLPQQKSFRRKLVVRLKKKNFSFEFILLKYDLEMKTSDKNNLFWNEIYELRNRNRKYINERVFVSES